MSQKFLNGVSVDGGNITVGESNATNNHVKVFHSDETYTELHGFGIITDRTSYYIRPSTDGTQALYIGGADASLDWTSINFKYTSSINFVRNGTTIFDLNSSNNATFAGNLTVEGGTLNLSDGTTFDSIINAGSSLTLNFDSDNNSTGELFRIHSNTTSSSNSNKELFKITESGLTNINVMPGHESEGILRLGRHDTNATRYHDIKSYVSSTQASNYLKFSLHGGTENAVVDVLTLNGNLSATFAGTISSGAITVTGGSNQTIIDSHTAFDLTDGSKDTLLITNNATTSAAGAIGPTIGFGNMNSDRRTSAIGAIRTGDDHDNMGLAFFTHPGDGNDETVVKQLELAHDGIATFAGKLSLTAIASGSSGTLISTSNGADAFGYNATAGKGHYIRGTASTYIYGGGKFWDGTTTHTLLHDGSTISTSQITNLSGTNTGDQDLSGYLLNTTDTFTGTLTLTHATFGQGLVLNRNHASNAASIVFKNSTGQQGILYAISSDNQPYWRDGTTTNANKIWTSGNDGASSGLDADLLDGNHASAFAPSTVVNQTDFVSAANGGTFGGNLTIKHASSPNLTLTDDSPDPDNIGKIDVANSYMTFALDSSDGIASSRMRFQLDGSNIVEILPNTTYFRQTNLHLQNTAVSNINFRKDAAIVAGGDLGKINFGATNDEGTTYPTGGNIIYEGDGTWDLSSVNNAPTRMKIQLRNSSGTLQNAMMLSSNLNANFYGDLTVAGDLIVSGTTTTLNTETVEVEDNIIVLNKTQSDNSATATTSGISIYRGVDGNGAAVTQASLIFDEADDTWDFTNNLTVASQIDAGTKIGLPDGGDLFWAGGYGDSKPVLAANGTTMKMYPSGVTSGVQFSLSPTEAIFEGNIKTNSGLIHLQNDAPILRATSNNNASGFRIQVNGLDGNGDDLLRVQDVGTTKFNLKRDGDVANSWIPYTDSTYDLGSSSQKWANIYADTINGDITVSSDLSAASTIDYPLTILSKDDNNSINQAGGEGVGIQFKLAGNANTDPGNSFLGASIATVREDASDTNSSSSLKFFVSQNDETLDEALEINSSLNATFKGSITAEDDLEINSTMASSPSSNIFLDVDGTNVAGGGGSIIFGTSASAGTKAIYNATIRGTRSASGNGSSEIEFLTSDVSADNTGTPAVRMILRESGSLEVNNLIKSKRGTTGSPYDTSVGMFVQGGTRGIAQISSTTDGYFMFGDDDANNVAWLGYNHTTNQMSLHTGGSVNVDGTTTFTQQVIIQDDTVQPLSSLFEGTLVVQGSTSEDPIIAITDVNTANAAAGVFHQSSTNPGFPALVINTAANGSSQKIISARANVSNTTGVGGTEVFSVDGSGDVVLNDLTVNGTFSFTDISASTIRATSTGDASIGSTTHAFQTGTTSSTNIIMDNNEIMARNNGALSALNLNPDGGDINFGSNVNTTTISGSGDLTLHGRMNSSLRKYISASISNSYVVIYRAEALSSQLANSIRVTATSHGGSHVGNWTAEILVNHSQDVVIKSTSGAYTQSTLKVNSDGNEDYYLSVKTTSASAATYYFTVEALSSEVSITALPTSTPHTTLEVEHTTCNGTNITGNPTSMLHKITGIFEPVTNGGASLGSGSKQFSDLHLSSSAGITWGNGDAEIVEGETNNYSLTFKTYDGTANSAALRLDGDNLATFTGNVKMGSNKHILIGTDSGDAFNTSSAIRIQDNGHAYMQIKVGTSSQGGVLIGDEDDDYVGGFVYNNSSNSIIFKVNNTDSLSINSSNLATFTGKLRIQGNPPITANTNFDDLIISDAAHSGMSIFSGADQHGAIYFGDPDANNRGQIKYLHDSDNMTFGTDGATALTITSNQDTIIPVGKKLIFGGSEHTYITEDTNDRMRFFTGGAEFMRFTESTADTIDLYKNTNVTGDLDVSGAASFGSFSIGSLAIDGYKMLDMVNNSPEKGPWNPIVSAVRGSGKCVYIDEDFSDGSNSVGVYNNQGGTGVVHTRETDGTTLGQTAPNSSGYVIKIVNNGNATSPGRGGFVQSIPSADNKTFVQIFQAKLPTGYSVVDAQNAQGTNSTIYWLTNQAGTGKFEWYARVTQCGNTGTFSSGGHVYVNGGSAGDVFTWYLASCSLYEVSNGANFVKRQLTVGEYIRHEGDTDTNIRFQDDRVTINSGGGGIIDAHSNGNLYFTGTSTFYDRIEVINDTGITIKSDTNGAGANINFSDMTSNYSQTGALGFFHSDSASQGSAASFHFKSSEAQLSVVAGDADTSGKFLSKSQADVTEVDFGFYDDINTGMYRPGNHNLGLVTNGVERIRLTSGGHYGFGRDAKSGGTTWMQMFIGGQGNIISRFSDASTGFMIANNYYVNSSNADKHLEDGHASRVYMANNDINMQVSAYNATAPSADDTVTWKTAGIFTDDINTTQNPGLQMGASYLGFDQSGTRSWYINAAGGNLGINSGDSNGEVKTNTHFTSTGFVQAFGELYTRHTMRVLNATGDGWHTWGTRGGGKYDLDVNNIVARETSDYADANNVTISRIGKDKIRLQKNTSNSYGFAIHRSGEYNSFDVTFDMLPGTGATHWGLCFGYQDQNNWHGVVFRNNNNVRVQKQISGTQTNDIGETATGFDLDAGYVYKVRVVYISQESTSGRIAVIVNGKPIINSGFTAHHGGGQIGFAHYDSGSYVDFSNLQVNQVPNDDQGAFMYDIADKMKIQTKWGSVDIGNGNSSYTHVSSSTNSFYFNRMLTVDSGIVQSYNEDLVLRRANNDNHKITISETAITMTKNLQMGNLGIYGVNLLQINDPGPTEGIDWAGGNLWRISECPDNMTTNSGGNLQFSTNGTRRVTMTTGGTLNATGDVIAYSDERVKDNIETIDNALDKVSNLRGVSYNRNDVEDKSKKIGVIAQEVEKVLPEVVQYSESADVYSVAYGNMAGLFIEAIKELKAEVSDLKKEIQTLKNK